MAPFSFVPTSLRLNRCLPSNLQRTLFGEMQSDDDDDDGGSSNNNNNGRPREVIVHMNDPEANAEYNYPHNFIRTSKYTFFSFFPLALLFQFKKVSNIYFLFNMIVALIPGVATVSPGTAVAPLVFVVLVAMIKEGVEDVKRHRADDRANALPTMILRDGRLMEVMSRYVRAGDVVLIRNGDEVRADMVLFTTSAEENLAFIDTCNLDGETNLKARKAIDATWELNNEENISNHRVTLHTSKPSPSLHIWSGYLEIDGHQHSVSVDQFLYRGCVLRNTDWVWGMVVYAGIDTKMFKNLKDRPMKSSSLDSKLNRLIIMVFVLQNICLFLVCSLAVRWNNNHLHDWYLVYLVTEYTNGKLWGYRYLTYFILLSYFIPISLFVTIELCKVVQAYWMLVDAKMMEFMQGRWRHCIVNTSNLNEQLALVKLIFTDKTGTLTENLMCFKQGDILGLRIDADHLSNVQAFVSQPDKSTSNSPSASFLPASSSLSYIPPSLHTNKKNINRFNMSSSNNNNAEGKVSAHRQAVSEYFMALALCNTIQPFKDEKKEHGLVYEGSSPDEVALIETAASVSFRMIKRTTRSITLMLPNNVERKFNILAVLEFSPNRKMMSIIVQDDVTHKIMLYNKGADSFVKPQLLKTPEMQAHVRQADLALTEMSSIGLRTLMICAKELTEEEFDNWNIKFLQATMALQNRADRLDEVCIEMERDLRLVGITGIEDKLQQYVPETIAFFLNAGVIIWMLTGDKRETAVTIAATSSLLDPRSDYVDHIDIESRDPESQEAIDKVLNDLQRVEVHLDLRDATQRNLLEAGQNASEAAESEYAASHSGSATGENVEDVMDVSSPLYAPLVAVSNNNNNNNNNNNRVSSLTAQRTMHDVQYSQPYSHDEIAEDTSDSNYENNDNNYTTNNNDANRSNVEVTRETMQRCTFVIDGAAMEVALEHHFDKFLHISMRVNSAVCCRLTPLQKARMVRMFQKSSGVTALAIGDGANDVTMIREARVGVGVIGVEGAQAALAADYAIPRFHHLRRLCAIHGRYSLLRNASCISVSFYKNFVLSIVQFIFSFYAVQSGLTIFDGWLLTIYNMLLTSLPPFLMGIFEKDLPEEALMERPKLYTPLSHGLYFNAWVAVRWLFISICHAFLIFYVGYPELLSGDTAHRNYGGAIIGTQMFCGMTLMVLLCFAMHIRYWQWMQMFGIFLEVCATLLLLIIYSVIPAIVDSTEFYWQFFNLAVTPKFWIYLVFWCSCSLMFGIIYLYISKRFFPTSRDIAEKQFLRRNHGRLEKQIW